MRADDVARSLVVLGLALGPGLVRGGEGPRKAVLAPISTVARPSGRQAPTSRTTRPPDGLRLTGEAGVAGGALGPQAGKAFEDCGLVQDYDLLGIYGRQLYGSNTPLGRRRIGSHGGSIFWAEGGERRLWKADFEAQTIESIADRVGDAIESVQVFSDKVFWIELRTNGSGFCGNTERVLRRAFLDGHGARTLATFSGCSPHGPLAVDEEAAYVLSRSSPIASPETFSITRVLYDEVGSENLLTTTDYVAGIAVNGPTLFWQQLTRPSGVGQIKTMPKVGGPATTLADGLGSPWFGGLVIDGAELFFTESYRLLKISLSGGPPVVLVESPWLIEGMAVSGENVYWLGTGGVRAVPRTGGPQSVLAPVHNQGFLVVDGSHAYWTQSEYPAGRVMRVPVEGGQVVTVRDLVDTPGALALDGDRMYFGEGGRVAALPKAGGEEVTLASGISSAITPIATDGTFVYVGDGAYLKRVPASGGAVETIRRTTVSDLATDGAFLFWVGAQGQGTGYVQKMPLGGPEPPVTLATTGGGRGSIWLVGAEVFWYEPGSGWVRKVSKDGGDATNVYFAGPYSEIVIDESGIYEGRPGLGIPGTVSRRTLSGTDPVELVTGFTSNGISLAVDEHDLYWIHEGEVAKVPKAGGPLTFLTYGLQYTHAQEALLPLANGDLYFTFSPLSVLVRARPANALEFVVSAASASESAGRAIVTVTRSGNVVEPSFVDYETSDGDALAGLDYLPRSGRLAFGPKSRFQTFEVPLLPDFRAQGSRSLLLRLNEPRCGRLGDRSVAVLTIADDDQAGRIVLGSSAYTVSEPGPYVTVTVQRLLGLAGDVSVDYATVDGTAQAGTHYLSVAGTLSFGPGVKSRTLAVPILDDGVVDANKTFGFVLSQPGGGASLGSPSTAAVTIQEGNPVLQFAAATFSATETARSALVSVRRSGPTAGAVSVDFATTDGTAKQGERYQAVSGTLAFGPGIVTRSFLVPLLNDTLFQGTQTALLSLDRPSAGAVVGGQATAVLAIGDNDRAGTLAFSASAYRVSRSAAAATVSVRRSGGTAGGVEVHYTTADGTGKQGVHYTATSGILYYGPGVVNRTFTVPVLDPGVPTSDTTVLLTLSDAAGGALLTAPASATLVIEAIEPELAFSASSYAVNEAGPVSRVTVRRSGPKSSTVTVKYSTADDTAEGGVDYTPASGVLTFGPNVVAQTFDVAVSASAEVEGDQKVTLHLDDPQGGAVLGEPRDATLTIRTDDPALQFLSTAITAAEAGGKAVVRVRRGPPVSSAVSVELSTAEGSATSGSDYDSVSGPLYFPARSVLQTVTVPIVNDTLDEPLETFHLSLHDPQGAILGSADTATVRISDNDVAGQVRFEGATYSARESSGVAVLTVVRAGGASSGARVHYATADGTAVAGTHYEASSGTLEFEQGETMKMLAVPLIDDLAAGPNRTVLVHLTDPEGGASLVAPARATLWIVDGGG